MNKIEHTPFDLGTTYPTKRKYDLSSGRVIWITGLSGSGKTTLANELNKIILSGGFKPILLDGDNMRKTLFEKIIPANDYGYDSRKEFGKAYSRLSHLLASQGFIVITSVIAMFDEIFIWNRNNLPGYFEVYLKTPIKELQKRDSKSIYSDFVNKKIKNVAGLDLEKEEPKYADLILEHKKNFTPQKKALEVMSVLTNKQYFLNLAS